jgi:hypothetical protein
MIYKNVSINKPIRQGDIFHNLSLVRFDLLDLLTFQDDNSILATTWEKIEPSEIQILANLEKTHAIVLSQDCDCLRSPFLSLIVIKPLNKNFKTQKNWMDFIINLNKRSPSKMYLPPDDKVNIPIRMQIDFSHIFPIDRKNLEALRKLRLARLNKEAMDHFREKAAYYFHRYGYDEYYPLNKAEMDSYEMKEDEKYNRHRYQKN